MEMIKTTRKRKRPEPVNNLDLQSLLKNRNIDVKRYEPIGAGFYHQYEDCFDASVICIDRQRLMENKPYLVKIILEDFTNEEYMQFRKKFEVIINPEYRNYYNLNFTDVLLQSEVND
jgi:hypothetical protein